MAKTSKSMKTAGALSALHRLFAHEVVRPGASAASAYRLVYPNASARTAETNGPALLRKTQVAEYVAQLREKQIARIDAKAQKVLDELEHIGMARLSNVLRIHPDASPSVSVKPIEEWGEHERAALTKVKVEKIFEGRGPDKIHVGDVLEVQMREKKGALDTLAKHRGLVKDHVEVEVTKGHADIVAEALRQLEAERSGRAQAGHAPRAADEGEEE